MQNEVFRRSGGGQSPCFYIMDNVADRTSYGKADNGPVVHDIIFNTILKLLHLALHEYNFYQLPHTKRTDISPIVS